MKKQATKAVKILKSHGHQAYFVGGCVRDTFLNRQPKDFDIATNATTEQIIETFKGFDTVDVGAHFGTINVIMDGEWIDITTFRADSTESDGRKPESVQFVSSIEEDLSRRDLTINAIAFDPITEEIVDPFNGVADIQNKKIRFVGNAVERITEDQLRLLRFFRFFSVLDFSIDDKEAEEIKKAIKDKVISFESVSEERIQMEFAKIMGGKNVVEVVASMAKLGALQLFVPEVQAMIDCEHNTKFHKETFEGFGNSVFAHTLHVIKHAERIAREKKVDRKAEIVMAAFFHDIGKPSVVSTKEDGESTFRKHELVSGEMTRTIMKRLRFSNDEIKFVSTLVEEHMDFSGVEQSSKKPKIRRFFGRPHIVELGIVSEADELGRVSDEPRPRSFDEVFEQAKKRFPVMLPDPVVRGQDIMFLKLVGKQNKEMLDKVFNVQLTGIEDKETLLKQARAMVKDLRS